MFTQSQCLPTKYSLVTKGHSSLPGEGPGGHHLSCSEDVPPPTQQDRVLRRSEPGHEDTAWRPNQGACTLKKVTLMQNDRPKPSPELSGPRRPVDMTLGSSSTRTQLGFSFCQKALSEPGGEM